MKVLLLKKFVHFISGLFFLLSFLIYMAIISCTNFYEPYLFEGCSSETWNLIWNTTLYMGPIMVGLGLVYLFSREKK